MHRRMLIKQMGEEIHVNGRQSVQGPKPVDDGARILTAPEWFQDAKLGIYTHWTPTTEKFHCQPWQPRPDISY
ncbi:hypothetical protein DXV75_11650 [Alteromonas aestuariivivens]|uniref:Glycoside hydrolase family 29 N-terminal domain-containing protein n=1 Tax=Alteromonas aestuariivivens TaxID=1938339 RepID=A0A3D8M6R1_9ALTE|nr:hypothetical protein DXV75_11650 [Alteromonas aestuariivivens]